MLAGEAVEVAVKVSEQLGPAKRGNMYVYICMHSYMCV